MAPRIEWDKAATAELAEAIDWYREHSQRAALNFVAAISRSIAAVVADPNRFQRALHGCRQCRVSRYPYTVIFHEESDVVMVVAIAHAKRRLGYWTRRLS